MNILILNGSPRPNGNTVKMINAFTSGAEVSGHSVNTVNVCRKNIHGCLACEYCHNKGNFNCVQKDDMVEVYELLKQANMLVIASPIYYHGLSGQLKCTIDRFYSTGTKELLPNLKKVAMLLASGDPDMYDGALFSLKGDFENFFGLENVGVYTVYEYDKEDKEQYFQSKWDEIYRFASELS